MTIHQLQSSPHTRGCFRVLIVVHRAERSSPHTRGCFQLTLFPRNLPSVFPAYAGVFPDRPPFFWADVFPAYAGVFLLMLTAEVSDEGLPRIRGGVSDVIFKK